MMPRFNIPVQYVTLTHNLAGGEAYSESPKLELVSHLLTSFTQDQFYRSADEGLERLRALLGLVDPQFAAKAAVFARDEFGMRSITHVVAGEIAHSVKGESWTAPFFNKVVVRVDDITEILAYYTALYGKRPIPASLKRGLAAAFGKFDAYQLGKYRAEGKGVSLVDVVNLVHPKEPKDALKALVEGTLRSEDTWETELTRAGQNADSDEDKVARKADAWGRLITERKIGYFALLRNLRNIIEQAPEYIASACAMLTDRRLIVQSRVLPFRFQTAREAIEGMSGLNRLVLSALNVATDMCLSNIPTLPGKTLVAVDTSGSMEGRPIDIASLFGAAIYKTQDADLMVFSSDASYFNINPSDTLTTMAERIKSVVPGGTNFHAIFERADKPYDRIIILSDMQAWMGYHAPSAEAEKYRHRTSSSPHIYSWDLAGHGSLQFPEHRVYALAGFSEKVFGIMGYLEEDRNALVNRIEQIQL